MFEGVIGLVAAVAILLLLRRQQSRLRIVERELAVLRSLVLSKHGDAPAELAQRAPETSATPSETSATPVRNERDAARGGRGGARRPVEHSRGRAASAAGPRAAPTWRRRSAPAGRSG